MNHLVGPLGNVLTSTPPSAPTNVTMSRFIAGNTGVTVTWTASTGATSYTVDFYSNTTPSTTGGSLFQTRTVSTTTATSTNILGGARYYYAIVSAVNVEDISSATVTSSSITTVFTSVTGLFVWLDSQDPTSYTLSGSTLTTPGWIDKVTSLAFRPKNGGASNVVTSSTNYPTISNPGTTSSGIYFPNASSTPSSTLSVGIQANLSSNPLTFPTQNMTFCILITNSASNNSGYRCCLQLSKNSIATLPNVTVSFHTNVSEGFAVTQDYNGSAWGRTLATNQPTHTTSKQILIGTSSSSSTTVFQNGTSIFSNTTVYNSALTNYNIYNLGIAVNNNANRCWEGTVHEIMIFNRALTDTERIRVEGYLAWKCGINTSLPSNHLYRNNAFIVTMGTYRIGDTSISVSWDAVSGATSYTVKFYSNITATTSSGSLVETNTNTDVSTTSRTSTFTLLPNTYYYASVTTINYGGTSSEQVSSSTIQTPDAGGIITTIAGNVLGDGDVAISAQLRNPNAISLDSAGNVYISDSANHCIRKITGTTITTIAGTGVAGFSGDGGPATSATLHFPRGVAVDSAGNVYISDGNNQRIRKITGTTITTIAGTGVAGFSGDGGDAIIAQVSGPSALAVDSAGNLYIADTNNNRIRKITGTTIRTIAGTGVSSFSGDGGLATSATLKNPNGVVVDSAGNVYISDYTNHRIRKITGTTITTIAGTGVAGFSGNGGSATSAQLNFPNGVAVDSAGNVYISDYINQRIRKITGTTITTIAGTGLIGFSGDGGSATSATLNYPNGVAVDSTGNVYILDYINQCIRKITGTTITRVAGGMVGDGGPATSAQLNLPNAVSLDSAGNVYISDSTNHRIRKITGTTITTIAGTGLLGFSGDGGPATSATIYSPRGVAVDSSGNVYIADSTNHRIRKITGTTITTIAGTGVAGFSGDGGLATSAQLKIPSGLAVDSAGNLYISEYGNHCIRKITGTTITTIAGTGGVGGFSGDGGAATSAKLSIPFAFALDSSGNVYIADTNNNRIRKITGTTITTIAGTGVAGFSGDGGLATSATLKNPTGVALDSARNVYIADSLNYRIRKITGTTITTIAGTGVAGFSGDGGDARLAELRGPNGVVLDSAGNVYISDSTNHRIRKITF